MIELPKQKIEAETQNPRKLLIFSKPKSGKTTLLAGLEGCLIIDLESGSEYVDALKIKATSLEELIEVGKAIKVENEKQKRKVYKYIALDTVTKLEEYAWQLALRNYKNTLVGKNFQGDSNALRQLAKGAGYPLN